MALSMGLLGASVPAAPVGDFELIEERVLSTVESSVIFSSLSAYAANYKHLQIRVVARSTRSTASSDIGVQFNGATTDYFWHEIQGNGSSGAVEGGGGGSQTGMRLGQTTAATSSSTSFAPTVIDLLDPFSTSKNKTFRGMTGVVEGPRVRFTSGSRADTTVINEVKLYDYLSFNFAIGSRFSLYGIRG